jgi:lipoate-protein ligase A
VEASAQRKVPGGKLVRVRLQHDGTSITSAEVSGDFFVHPEESISVIESALVGLPVRTSEGELGSIIGRLCIERNIIVLGFSPTDLAELVKRALA